MVPSPEFAAAVAAWSAEQDALDIPMIEQTVKARTPSGRPVEVNRFDFNLAFCTDSYVQCTDSGWIKARILLPPIPGQRAMTRDELINASEEAAA